MLRLLCALLLVLPSLAFAQGGPGPNGQPPGNVTATTTATAASTPPTVSAGTGLPLVINLSSALFTQPTYAGTPVDGTHGLPVNCISGCAGGTASNASSSVATSSTNGTTNAWLYAFNGATWDQLQDDGSKNLKINIAAGSIANTSFAATQATASSLNATVVGTGTFAVQAAQSGTWNIGGLAASGASVSGNPILGGARAQNAEQTAVTNGQAVAFAADLAGKQIVSPYANKENFVGGTVSVTGTTSTSLVSAPGANLYLYITAVSCFNSGSTLTTVSFQNGSGGTTIWEGVAAPTGGGFTHTFPVPIGGVNNMAANTALYIQAGSATTTLYCNASGYKGT